MVENKVQGKPTNVNLFHVNNFLRNCRLRFISPVLKETNSFMPVSFKRNNLHGQSKSAHFLL